MTRNRSATPEAVAAPQATPELDWPALRHEAHTLACDLLPRLDRPPGRLVEGHRRTHAYLRALRNYAINRRLARAGREQFRPLYFIWTTLRRCNFSCDYCDDHRGRKYPDLPLDGTLDTEQATKLLRIMSTGTSALYFSGGEPTLRADLPLLTERTHGLGYHPIIVNTNASTIDRLLPLPSWRRWLALTDMVIVSLDGLDPADLAASWGYSRPADVIRNLLLLNELRHPLRFKLMVNTVIRAGRCRDARAVLDLARRLEIGFCPVPQNRHAGIDPALLNDPEYPPLVELILERKRAGQRIAGSQRLVERLLRSEPLVCRNTLKPHIDHDGTLFWPCKSSVNVAPAKLNVLEFDSVAQLWNHASTLIDPTGFHGPGADRCGGNCNWAQNYSTDAYAYGLHHPSALLAEVVNFLRAKR